MWGLVLIHSMATPSPLSTGLKERLSDIGPRFDFT